jgi:hypothetical protein
MQRPIARLLVTVSVCAAGATHAQGKDIGGQVFIVTRGGPAIKLALVRVAAFRKADMETHVRDIDSQLADERAKADAEVSEASRSLQRAKRAVAGGLGEWMKRDAETHGRETNTKAAIDRGHSVWQKFHAAEQKIAPAETRLREAVARQRLLSSAAPYFAQLPEPFGTAKTDADGRFKLTVPDEETVAVLASSSRTIFDRVETYFWVVRLAPNETSLTLSNDNLTTSGSVDSLVTTRE